GAIHPRGDRRREESAVHRVLRTGGGQGHGHALSRCHRAGRAFPSPARPLPAPPIRHHARRPGGRPPRRRAHHVAGRRDPARGPQDRRHSPRPRLLIGAAPALRELATLASRPDGRLAPPAAALTIARWTYPAPDAAASLE